ncbi:hypothetical protein B0H63DRAFT_34953 [Podospora didyma]|uniref:FR47-like domain-containing protein n=1 Tax=Podospora didyma TaxID=330526 RepID=A0AAE0U7W0_9PEZI|nr:hypothetical protein B0H63DRAFT_34953 [Podospora didyma]
MAIIIQDNPTPSDALLSALQAHLPFSLPLLRRLQFTRKFNNLCSTPSTHILYASPLDSNAAQDHFAAAYVDLSNGPETECWLYTTLEDHTETTNPCAVSLSLPDDEAALCDTLVQALLRRIRALDQQHDDRDSDNSNNNDNKRRGTLVMGSLHEAVRRRMLAKLGVRMSKTPIVPDHVEWDWCGKWLFRVEELRHADDEQQLPEGMSWDGVTREDTVLVRARTKIPRQEETLLRLPSTVIRLDNGTPIAWAFMGLDGSLMTLHVEEEYRGQGLAKAIGCRLMRDHIKDYGEDGWRAADVMITNLQSQGVCKSIGGKLAWTVSWAVVDLLSVGDAM